MYSIIIYSEIPRRLFSVCQALQNTDPAPCASFQTSFPGCLFGPRVLGFGVCFILFTLKNVLGFGVQYTIG